MTWKFSRSHDECYLDCPRKCYLQYYYQGTGVVRKGFNLEQATGTLTHAMLESVLRHALQFGECPPPLTLEGIVARCVDDYRNSIRERGFDAYEGTMEYEISRQCALAEGLVRAWVRSRMPGYLESYDILGVEVERETPLIPGLLLLSRLDATVRRKVDGELFAGPEFKTTGYTGSDYFESFRYSTQMLSHIIDVEAEYGKRPAGVLLEILYKGAKKKQDDGSTTYYSPLVRGYRNMDPMTGDIQFGHDTKLAYKKGWTAFDTWTMGMDNWVRMLPEEVIADQLFGLEVFRSDRELDIWKRQVIERQSQISYAIGLLEVDGRYYDSFMNRVFPARLDQFCYSNKYRKKCEYLPVCYGEIDDPLASGEYVNREPHHPSEFAGGDEQ